jgi:hypothetical protein
MKNFRGITVYSCRDLFPEADPNNPDTVKRFEERLASEEADLEDYRLHHGQPGCHFRRGFKGQAEASIRRVRWWLTRARKENHSTNS